MDTAGKTAEAMFLQLNTQATPSMASRNASSTITSSMAAAATSTSQHSIKIEPEITISSDDKMPDIDYRSITVSECISTRVSTPVKKSMPSLRRYDKPIAQQNYSPSSVLQSIMQRPETSPLSDRPVSEYVVRFKYFDHNMDANRIDHLSSLSLINLFIKNVKLISHLFLI